MFGRITNDTKVFRSLLTEFSKNILLKLKNFKKKMSSAPSQMQTYIFKETKLMFLH